MSKHTFSVRGERTYLDDDVILVKGLRCSTALISDAATDDLAANLEVFASYGCNTVSVYFQGSRFGDIKGYREDASLDPTYAARMGRIIEAADEHSMAVLVGCLYWGNSRAKWESWTQAEANAAVANTVRWLAENNYRNTFVDVDNEGMALRTAGFDNRQMLLAGKAADPAWVIGTNYHGDPPPEADLALHHSNVAPGKPYIESEASPPGVAGGYWGPYSKLDGYYGYLNVGIYTPAMVAAQLQATREFLDQGQGYMLASTWLQAAPPQGPNQRPGGMGMPTDPGVRWWLEFLHANYNACVSR